MTAHPVANTGRRAKKMTENQGRRLNASVIEFVNWNLGMTG
jgi:hypothetical protein